MQVTNINIHTWIK